MNRLLRRISTVAACAAIALAAASVSADVAPADRAAARALFDQARSLAKEGKYTEACPKFEESQRLDPGMGTLFNLADCHEHAGRTATAWTLFLEVASQAKSSGQPDREKAARQRASSLEATLSRLSDRLDKSGRAFQEEREEAGGGVALVNVNNRIHLLFGEEYGLHVFSIPMAGTDVRITLPMITSNRELPRSEVLS